jgi:hypothetical protein
VRPDLREPSLRGLGEAVEDGARDRELEDAVPEELEPLVRLRADLGPGSVREDLLLPFGRELRYQPPELLGPGVERVSPGAR